MEPGGDPRDAQDPQVAGPSAAAPEGAPQHGPDADIYPLLLFDGECGLCAKSVRFILDRDKKKRLRFAPLQSELGRGIALAQGLSPDDLTTMILVEENGRTSLRSTAGLRICSELRMPWRLAKGLIIVPRFLRDAVYRWISKRRLQWFGTADSCRLPSPEEQARFLA